MPKLNKLQKIEKELFDMVYGWGRWGVVTDEQCNAFQMTIKKYKKQVLKESKNGKNS
jgi:hypothetical protein